MKAQLEGKALHITPEGDLVASRVEDLRKDLLKYLSDNQDAESIVLDAGQIGNVDSLGVNLIIGLYKQANSTNREFRIIRANEKFMKVASFFRFSALFSVETE